MALDIFYWDGVAALPSTLPYTGVFIPVTDLPGMDAEELVSTDADNLKQGKTIYSIIQKIHSFLTVGQSYLGFTSSLGNPVVSTASRVSFTYTMTIDYVTNLSTGKITMVPTPTTGIYSGVGKFSIKNIFPNSSIVDDTADVLTVAGVLLNTTQLANYGFFNDVDGSTIGTFNNTGDNRYAVASIYQAVCDGNVAVRTSTVASGITQVSIGNALAQTIPTTYTSAINPLTGISSVDLDHLSLTRRTYSITFELNLLPELLEINCQTL
jgi:hypothetical protein